MKKIVYKYFVVFLVVMAPLFVVAQTDPDDAAWNDEAPDEIPVDGGLSLFLAAGVGYGVKKANDLRKKKNGVESPNEIEK